MTYHVFHRASKPISPLEFRDAVLAVCKPRFSPQDWAALGRPRTGDKTGVGIAVSGGVDSMALAFLLARLRLSDPRLCIDNYPIRSLTGITIDHGLRDGSALEAAAVAAALRRLGILPVTRRLGRRALGLHGPDVGGGTGAEAPSNFETLARRARYRSLGAAAPRRLFVAHHRDDNYETVLMRLAAGHAFWGLRGIPSAIEIPECGANWAVSRSGMPLSSGSPSSPSSPSAVAVPDGIVPLATESYGVRMYRPLLHFDKDRLRATCEANAVPWWDDPTNADATLTMRNTVRRLVAGPVAQACLPVALRKPSVLDLARRSDARATALEAEAGRYLRRTRAIRSFSPNTGVLVVDLPQLVVSAGSPLRFALPSVRRLRLRLRRSHLRLVAALLIRRLMHFVSPEAAPPPVSDLCRVVAHLYPSLTESDSSPAVPPPRTRPSVRTDRPPGVLAVAFVHSSVFFQPLATHRWRLCRAPYPRALAPPTVRVGVWPRPARRGHSPEALHAWALSHSHVRCDAWIQRGPPRTLFDGRFWVRLEARVAGDFHIAPLATTHLAAFRDALPEPDRRRLAAVLRALAPAKARFTLPAVYVDAVVAPPDRPGPPSCRLAASPSALASPVLLALPTLGFALPDVDQWLRCHITYKSVDRSLFGLRPHESTLIHGTW